MEVWPDNLPAVNLLIAMGTQWRVGMAGATGLDYTPLPVVMRHLRIPPADRDTVFDELRILEDAALETMRSTKK